MSAVSVIVNEWIGKFEFPVFYNIEIITILKSIKIIIITPSSVILGQNVGSSSYKFPPSKFITFINSEMIISSSH